MMRIVSRFTIDTTVPPRDCGQSGQPRRLPDVRCGRSRARFRRAYPCRATPRAPHRVRPEDLAARCPDLGARPVLGGEGSDLPASRQPRPGGRHPELPHDRLAVRDRDGEHAARIEDLGLGVAGEARESATSDASAVEITITEPSSPEIASRLPSDVNETWMPRPPRVATGAPTGSSVFASRKRDLLAPTERDPLPVGAPVERLRRDLFSVRARRPPRPRRAPSYRPRYSPSSVVATMLPFSRYVGHGLSREACAAGSPSLPRVWLVGTSTSVTRGGETLTTSSLSPIRSNLSRRVYERKPAD